MRKRWLRGRTVRYSGPVKVIETTGQWGVYAGERIVLGDGRLSLEREQAQGYDVLAIDAFSGDSIPMHLLTQQAMESYLKHLTRDGVIVFQATNRFVDIVPVVERLAAQFDLTAVMISDQPDGTYASGFRYWESSTDQIIVTRNFALLSAPALRRAAEPLKPRPDLTLWTDDYYNMLQILKR